MRKLTPFSGQDRARAGLTVTAVDLETGQVQSWQRGGGSYRVAGGGSLMVGLLDVLREIVAELDARAGCWRIRTLSSPTSILNDLHLSAAGADHVPYEVELLGRIERLDLLERPPRSKKPARKMREQILRRLRIERGEP